MTDDRRRPDPERDPPPRLELDPELDALIRAAAAADLSEADTAATARAVLSRIARGERAGLGSNPRLEGPLVAAAAIALLIAAGLGGYALPELLGGAEVIALLDLATGPAHGGFRPQAPAIGGRPG